MCKRPIEEKKKSIMSLSPCNLDSDVEAGQHAQKSSTKANQWASIARQNFLQCGLSQRHKLSSSQTI